MTKLCPRGKAAAKRKFKVYPSAYANAYASKICAGKIKDPSGVKRKDFRGPKPAKAMGGRIGYNSGSGRKGVKPGKKPNEIKMTPEQKEKRFDTPFRPKGETKMAPKPQEISRAKDKTRPRRAGGGLMAATERLRRQGYGKGGGVCIRGMNRDAVGKNS
jgi:hypothetical protein